MIDMYVSTVYIPKTQRIKIECSNCGWLSHGLKTHDEGYDIYTYDVPLTCSECDETLDERDEV